MFSFVQKRPKKTRKCSQTLLGVLVFASQWNQKDEICGRMYFCMQAFPLSPATRSGPWASRFSRGPLDVLACIYHWRRPGRRRKVTYVGRKQQGDCKPMQEVWLVAKNAVRIWLNVVLEEENLHRSALWHMLHHESNPRCDICCPIKRLWHCFWLKLGDLGDN